MLGKDTFQYLEYTFKIAFSESVSRASAKSYPDNRGLINNEKSLTEFFSFSVAKSHMTN